MNTPEATLAKFRDIVVVNSTEISLALSQQLRKQPDQRAHFGGNQKWGFIYLFRSDKVHPGNVLECVVSPAGDAITSVYREHSAFASLGDLTRAREELIRALAQRVGISVEGMGIDDAGRGRTLSGAELSTGQLIDLLAEQAGASVAVTNSHGADLEKAEVSA